MKEKPGVMLYFDRLPYLNRMDDTQRGKLFLWIMEYAQYGVIPEIEDAMLGMAWDVVKPAIDLDTERYEAKCERNRENIQKRWNKDSNTTVSSRIPNTKTKQTLPGRCFRPSVPCPGFYRHRVQPRPAPSGADPAG